MPHVAAGVAVSLVALVQEYGGADGKRARAAAKIAPSQYDSWKRRLMAVVSRNKSAVNGCTGSSRMGSRRSNVSSGVNCAEPVGRIA